MGFGYSGGIKRLDDVHGLDKKDTPNSRTDLYKNGKLFQQRWYGPDGRAARNRDHNNHGNPKEHPNVPHDHPWDWEKSPPRQEEIAPDKDWN